MDEIADFVSRNAPILLAWFGVGFVSSCLVLILDRPYYKARRTLRGIPMPSLGWQEILLTLFFGTILGWLTFVYSVIMLYGYSEDVRKIKKHSS